MNLDPWEKAVTFVGAVIVLIGIFYKKIRAFIEWLTNAETIKKVSRRIENIEIKMGHSSEQREEMKKTIDKIEERMQENHEATTKRMDDLILSLREFNKNK